MLQEHHVHAPSSIDYSGAGGGGVPLTYTLPSISPLSEMQSPLIIIFLTQNICNYYNSSLL